MFSSTIAPLILCLCGIAFICLGVTFRRAGRPGKAAFDFICAVSLFIVAYYVASGMH